MRRFWLVLVTVLVFLAGCSTLADGTVTPVRPVVLPTASNRDLPVTYTPESTAVFVTPTPRPTLTAAPPTETPVNFAETAVELRYRIPAIGLDRRLQGTFGSQIIFADEASGLILQRSNQGLVLLELQQVLPGLTLEPLPEGCDTCVYLEYALAASGETGAGWLQDPILLASVENLLAVVLGPHFPPDTLVGLRRSASPYAPAHTIALTTDGQVWVWLATEAEISEPLPETAVADIRSALENLELDALAGSYETNCPGVPLESLSLVKGTEAITIDIACPEYTLPDTLLPLYLPLDMALSAKLEAAGSVVSSRPPAGFPLTALLDYKRSDGARLTVYEDGLTLAQDAATAVYTTTLSSSQIISLTTPLLESGLVNPGLTTFFSEDEPEGASLLLVRGPLGVLDGRWVGTETAVIDLDALLDQLIGLESATPEATTSPGATASPEMTPTLEVGVTPTP